MAFFRFFLRLWRRIFCIPYIYTSTHVVELPDEFEDGTIYIAGENGHLWFAALICPCGCGAMIQLGLIEHQRPRWQVTEHEDGTVSLYPSVWRKVGCKSHFILRQGRIVWSTM